MENKQKRNKFLLLLIIILLAIGVAYFIFNKLNVYSTPKIVNLVTEKREKPTQDYQLTSDNIEIGTYTGDHIYLRFNNAINGNESLNNFRKYLNVESTVVNISLPELKVKRADDVPTITEFDQAVRDNMKITFLSYENGKLKGVLNTKASEAVYWVRDYNDLGCVLGDMVGVCVKTIPLNVDLTINFEVQVK